MRDQPITFERLIHPVGTAEFLSEHWEKKPFVVERGLADYYAGIMSSADIDRIIGFGQLKRSQLKIARAAQDGLPEQVFYVDGESASDVNQLFHSYHQGHTAVLNFAQCYWEPAARLCSAVEKFFHFPAGVNVYVTPRGAQGFAPHFDAHDVFILQVEGSKSWRIYESWQERPGDGAHGSPHGTEQAKPIARELLCEPRHELRLNAGDLLYIPRGHVHEARTTDSSSIHVSIGVRAYTWTDLIGELIASEGLDDAELRRALPVGFSNSETALELIEDRLPVLFRKLAESSRVGDGVGRLRRRLIERMHPLSDAHLRALDRVDHIDLDTIVAKREGMMCHVRRNANTVEIAYPGNRMQGPADVEDAFRFIADAEDGFPVRALPSTLSDRSKLVLAKRAIREGLLTIAPS